MESQNSSTGQKNEADQQPNELPISSERDKSQEISDHIPLVSETIRLQIFWLIIAALPFAAGCRNKIHPGDRALSTDLECSSKARAR
jgi:hypothetical protein